MQLQIIFEFIKPDPNTGSLRTFNRGERYTVVGEMFTMPLLCGPCGNKVIKQVPYYNLLVDGKNLTVDAEFLGPTDPTVEEEVVSSMDKRLNTVGSVRGPYDDRPEPQDNSEANLKAFNAMAVFDLRSDDQKREDANKGLPLR